MRAAGHTRRHQHLTRHAPVATLTLPLNPDQADQGLDKALDQVDRAFNRVGERLSRGGSAASEYGQVRLG